jgi:hypothetical protein
MKKNERIVVDTRGRVFGLTPSNTKTNNEGDHIAKRRAEAERLVVQRRIESNRLAWIQSVNQCWNALRDNPRLWIEHREQNIQHIERQVIKDAEHYLASIDVPNTTKEMARQLREIAKEIARARKNERIDWWVFAPFKWPKVEITSLVSLLSDHSPDASGHLLKSIGYRVGHKGLEVSERREILRDTLQRAELPGANDLPPYSCGRLKRLAYTIAYVANNAKNNRRDYSIAVAEWKADLAWMKASFYLGKCDGSDFSWPVIR